MPGLQERLDRMTPEKALKEIEAALKKVLPLSLLQKSLKG